MKIPSSMLRITGNLSVILSLKTLLYEYLSYSNLTYTLFGTNYTARISPLLKSRSTDILL